MMSLPCGLDGGPAVAEKPQASSTLNTISGIRRREFIAQGPQISNSRARRATLQHCNTVDLIGFAESTAVADFAVHADTSVNLGKW
jgi:hypothetical protein